jgi:general secretion pathway protein I
MRYTPEEAGFTLLEVLIALAILAIVMIGLIKITADNTRNLWHLENKTLASVIAYNQVTLLRLSEEKPENQDGWETLSGRKWYWQAKRPVTTTMGLWRYQIKVYLEGDTDPYATLTSFMPDKIKDESAAPKTDK